MARRARPREGEVQDPATAEVRTLAREAGRTAFAALVRLAHEAKSESVRLAAIKELLDRGFGRAAASETGGGATAHLLVDDGYAN